MEARSQTAPQAHRLQGCNFSIVSGWAGFVKPRHIPDFKSCHGRHCRESYHGPDIPLEWKYLRDREHFRGYPVSKIIGYAGHWVCKLVSDSRALRDRVGFMAALFSPLERVVA